MNATVSSIDFRLQPGPWALENCRLRVSKTLDRELEEPSVVNATLPPINMGLKPGSRVLGTGPGIRGAIHIERNFASNGLGTPTRASSISARRSHLPIVEVKVGSSRELKEPSTFGVGLQPGLRALPDQAAV